MKSRDVKHHPGYDGNVYSTVEDEIENLRHGRLTQDFFLSGDISPTALSGNVNNYNPPGLSTATILRIDGGASDRNITGLAGGADGRILVIYNIGTTNSLILKGEDSGSDAANRFVTGDIAIRSMGGLAVQYDSTSLRWRPMHPRIATNTGLIGGTNLGLISLDFNALTEETSIDGVADFIPLYDTSAGGHRKGLPTNFKRSGGVQLLNSGSVSNAASLEIILTSFTAYRGFNFHLYNWLPVTNTVDLWMEFSTDGGSSWIATNYSYGGLVVTDAASSAAYGASSNPRIELNRGAAGNRIGNAAGGGWTGDIRMRGNFSTSFYPRVNWEASYMNDGGSSFYVSAQGTNETAQDCTAVRFRFSSGNISVGDWALDGLA